MTRDMMALRGLLRKSGDPDLPRAMIGFAAGRLMALKVGADTGAALGEKSPTRRGLRGVKLAISDAQEGIKAAVTPVPGTTWQRCRVHFMRNVLAHAGNSGRRVVSAVVATAFARDTAETARARGRTVAGKFSTACSGYPGNPGQECRTQIKLMVGCLEDWQCSTMTDDRRPRPSMRVVLIFPALLLLLGICNEADGRARRAEDLLLFSEKYQQRLAQDYSADADRVDAINRWSRYLHRIDALPTARRPTERDLHEQFFSDLFVAVLGYRKRSSGAGDWTIDAEYRTDVDATRPDGVLGFFTDRREDQRVQVVIELKGPDTDLDLRQNRARDRRTPVDQAFSYAHKFDDVRWVILSNYQEIRLYHRNSSKYALHFDLKTLPADADQKALFLRLFSAENLIARDGPSQTSRLYDAREEELKAISRRFYREYRDTRFATVKAILDRRPGIPPDDAVAAAQLLIDRMLFIAFLEDTGLIPRETIERAHAADNPFNPASKWTNFLGLFQAMDAGNEKLKIPPYNGGLFRHHDLIQSLDFPDGLLDRYKRLADYDFASDLKVNILGRVFEQSISDLELLKTSLRAGASYDDAGDSRRHDEGAYYTPEAVTAYIVDATLKPYLAAIRADLGEADLPALEDGDLAVRSIKSGRDKGRTRYPTQSAERRVTAHIAFYEAYMERLKRLRILDPSCGSGAFLVAAFDALVAEGRQVERELQRLGAPLLFTRWDREVLKNNLYGVDVSAESAEITRLSLWLKIASNREPLVALDRTIRVGNAVIDDPAIDPAQAFDWRQAFPEVFADGGFDIVLGNPPYVRHELIRALKPGLERFDTYSGTADLYVYFFELGHDLLKPGGLLGYIASNKWLRAGYGRKLRQFLARQTRLVALIDQGQEDLFEDATAYPALVVFRKQRPPDTPYDFIVAAPPFDSTRRTLNTRHLTDDAWLLHEPAWFALKQQMQRVGIPLGDWDIEINYGIKTGFNEAFIIDDAKRAALIDADPASADLIKPMLRGRDLEKWHVRWPGTWLIFTRQGTDIADYPAIRDHLEQYRAHLTPKTNPADRLGRKPGDYRWHEIQDKISYYSAFEQEKIVYPVIKNDTAFSLDMRPYYHNDKVFHIIGDGRDLRYLTAILNSDLIFWYLKNSVALAKGESLELREIYMRHVPVPQIDDAARQPFIDLADRLTDLHGRIENMRRTFLALLAEEFGLATPSARLRDWPAHGFRDLQAALKRAGHDLSGPLKEDWFERFTRRKTEIEDLRRQAAAAQADLNRRVNALYGLTPDQIAMIAAARK